MLYTISASAGHPIILTGKFEHNHEDIMSNCATDMTKRTQVNVPESLKKQNMRRRTHMGFACQQLQ